jgi:hypothetical protein
MVVAASLAFRVTAQSAAVDLGDVLGDEAKWALGPDAFLGEYQPLGFHFVDGKQTAMSSQKALLRFLGQEVCEARVYFDAAAVRRVELSVYNKGDAGAKGREMFEALVGATKRKIDEFAKDTGMTGKSTNERANYFVKRHQWVKRSPNILLEWAYVDQHRSDRQNVPYGAEYIKVLMVPGKPGGGGVTGVGGGMTANRPKGARAVKENVARGAGGDVCIENVPMVDQGQKGYCAAASSERVLRYYGIDVDQHQVAQLANTAAEGGTTLDGMAKAIAKVGRQFQLDKRDLISPDTDVSFERSDHVKLIDQYNSVAKKKKAATIDWQAYVQDHTVDLPAIWQAMDPEILLAARTGQKQAMSQFVKNIKSYADQGVPLLWSCLVGLYPEEPPLGENGAFGHVRLIIGYNDKTQEILYSDSWGPSHALKRLPLDKAWAMTKGLIVLKPRDVR